MLNLTASEPADAQDAAEGAGKLQMVLEMDMDIWQVSPSPSPDHCLSLQAADPLFFLPLRRTQSKCSALRSRGGSRAVRL